MKPIKFKCRASMAGKIMTETRGQSNYDKYVEAKARIEALNKRLYSFKDQNGTTATEIRNKRIPKAISDLEKYDKIKHITELSETCKTYLKEWIIENKYGRKKEFSSKQTEKGNITEHDGFDVIQNVLYPGVFLPKNKQHYEDEYKSGTPDVIVNDTVIDNKSSYTIFTFPFAETEISNKDYIYQGHTYMDLTGKKKFKLCYTLNDTPFHIVEGELKSWCYKNNVHLDEMPEKTAYEIIKNHIYTKEGLKTYSFVLGTYDTSKFIELPIEKRIISFDLEYDREVIERINTRVIECEEWVQNNWDKF